MSCVVLILCDKPGTNIRVDAAVILPTTSLREVSRYGRAGRTARSASLCAACSSDSGGKSWAAWSGGPSALEQTARKLRETELRGVGNSLPGPRRCLLCHVGGHMLWCAVLWVSHTSCSDSACVLSNSETCVLTCPKIWSPAPSPPPEMAIQLAVGYHPVRPTMRSLVVIWGISPLP